MMLAVGWRITSTKTPFDCKTVVIGLLAIQKLSHQYIGRSYKLCGGEHIYIYYIIYTLKTKTKKWTKWTSHCVINIWSSSINIILPIITIVLRSCQMIKRSLLLQANWYIYNDLQNGWIGENCHMLYWICTAYTWAYVQSPCLSSPCEKQYPAALNWRQ